MTIWPLVNSYFPFQGYFPPACRLPFSLSRALSHSISPPHAYSIQDIAYIVLEGKASESLCSLWTCVRLKDILLLNTLASLRALEGFPCLFPQPAGWIMVVAILSIFLIFCIPHSFLNYFCFYFISHSMYPNVYNISLFSIIQYFKPVFSV